MTTHRLSAIISQTEEKFLGDFDDFYKAIEAAEVTFKNYNGFRICNEKNCIVGTRMQGNGADVFWRIPRTEKERGRDRKVWKIFDKLFF